MFQIEEYKIITDNVNKDPLGFNPEIFEPLNNYDTFQLKLL